MMLICELQSAAGTNKTTHREARFADGDMFARYRGGFVGHQATREATDYFLSDRDDVDQRFHVDEDEDDAWKVLEAILAQGGQANPEDADAVANAVENEEEDEGLDRRYFIGLQGDESDEGSEDEDMDPVSHGAGRI
jgi:hypothetical protein